MHQEDKIRDILTKIVYRASRPVQAGTTVLNTQAVPSELIRQAKEILEIKD